MVILLCLSSILIGFLIGGSGVGGVLLIPALMFLGGLETHAAMGTALASFFFTGILATWSFQRYGSIDWRLALPVLGGSLASSFPGAATAAHATAFQLNLLLAAIIISTSLYSLRPARPVASGGNRSTLAERLTKRGNLFLLLGIGVFTGFLCGMTGAGGGIISLPVMLLCGYPALPSIAAGQVLQSIVSLSGSGSNLANGFVDFSLLLPVTVCELAGVGLGVRLAHAVPVALLKRSVSWLCLGIGAFVLIQALLKG